MTKLLKLFRRPADVQPLIWWLRIGFLVLYWVVWVGLRGLNVITIATLHNLLHNPVKNDSRIAWLIVFEIFYILFEVLFNLFFIVFKHLEFFIKIHISNFFILFFILLRIVADHYEPFILLIYSLRFLFDILILLFFLLSKKYGFFRERHDS